MNAANAGVSTKGKRRDNEAMLEEASEAGRRTSVTISVAFGCPFDGEVSVDAVVWMARRAAEGGAGEIALGDTIGVAVPTQVTATIESIRPVVGDAVLRCHFHDTRNTATANAVAAYQAERSVLDASVGGTGGCPFAPNATGNVATEDLLYLFERMGVYTGIDHEATIATGRWLGEQLGQHLHAAVGRAGGVPE